LIAPTADLSAIAAIFCYHDYFVKPHYRPALPDPLSGSFRQWLLSAPHAMGFGFSRMASSAQ